MVRSRPNAFTVQTRNLFPFLNLTDADTGFASGVEIEQVLALGFDGAAEDFFELLFVGRCEGTGLQHDASDAKVGGGEELLFAAVPADVLAFFGEVCEVLRVEGCGQKDLPLPFLGIELGDGEPGLVCEVVVAVDGGGLAVSELEDAVFGIFGGGDALGIGVGEQEAGVVGVGSGIVGLDMEELAVGGGGFLDFFPLAIAALFGAVAAEAFDTEIEVGTGEGAVERIAFFKQGGDVGGEGQFIELLRGDEHIGQSRVQRQAVDLFAVVGDLVAFYGAECCEEFFGAVEGCGWRIIEPTKRVWIVDAPFEEIEQEWRKVAVEDFGCAI